MRAIVFDGGPRLADIPEPTRGLVLEVKACAVCRTDLHIVDGELPNPKVPVVLGHQIVGVANGQRVGVPWLGSTDGTCKFCTSGRENLCDNAEFTGYTREGCSGARRYSTEQTATDACCARSHRNGSCIQFAPNVHPPPCI